MRQAQWSAQIDGLKHRSSVRERLSAAPTPAECGSSIHSRSVSGLGSGRGYSDSATSSHDTASGDGLVVSGRSDSAMSLLPNGLVGNRPQMHFKTQQPKPNWPLQACCKSPLLPRGRLSQPATLMADAVSGKQAGSWPPAMPASTSPHQLRLKAHPLSWPLEEEHEEVTATNEQPAVTRAVHVEQPAASCAITKEEEPTATHASPFAETPTRY